MATLNDLDPNLLLSREATAERLTERGLPTSHVMLRDMVVRGGGPPYHRYGRAAVYRWGDVVEWAEARMGPPRRTTAELDAATPK